MRKSRVQKGMRVEAGEPGTEDHDSGKVLDLNLESATGHEVLVGWDSGAQTWIEARDLRPES